MMAARSNGAGIARTGHRHAGTLPAARRLGILGAMLCLSQAAGAGTATGTLTVTATVASTCVVSASALAFGSPSSAAIQAGNIDIAGTMTVNCTTGSTYTVGLDKGSASAGTTAVRQMVSGTNLLNYTISNVAAGGTSWTDVTGGWVTGTGNGAAQTLTAYGRITAGQTVPVGTYADTVHVTVTY